MLKSYSHYSNWPQDEWPWQNFSPREMASKREGELRLNTRAMGMLQELRTRLGIPLLITSAYRSAAHNRAVGGAKGSKHVLGQAFDVRMDNQDPQEFERVAREVGFQGFGFYPSSGFMHIDMGPSREWGRRWPKTATSLPSEPSRKPPIKSTVGLAAAGAAVVGPEYIPVAANAVGSLVPIAQIIAVVAIVGIVAFLMWKAWPEGKAL